MSLPFNVRVYGILIHQGQLLVSDEEYNGIRFTKFPGGGLQFGEGTVDCLKREFIEEMGLEIDIRSHFYTVDFFQPSAFNPQQQVISIYYLVHPTESDFSDPASGENNQHQVRWIALDAVNAAVFSLPIDKKVAGLIQKI